jgi:tRNA A-37 threonylcarbamoyl transferase component Bud32
MAPMNPSPAQQWTALSALYEQADGLAADALAAWLARLEHEANPLLPQLRRMLAARAEVETNDFLGTLPKLATADPKASVGWAEGKHVGPYRLLRPLGEGGMAEVWLAERADGVIKRRVAIKLPFPRPGRETFAVRFDRERDILATLRHPNIAGLYDAGVTAEGQAWLALEYIDGEPLAAWCDQRRLALRERVTLFRQVLLAVQHAHANLVIHRDLKPANILVTAQGGVRLLDFGIAKLLEAEGDAMPETELTRAAGRTLTLRYASPEQLAGLPLTTACDVYSLGVVFYELVSGERPHELKVESALQLEHAILEIEPRAPSRRSLSEVNARARGGLGVKALRKALAPELDAIALRCLARQTAARYSSVDAVMADIDRWLGGEAVLARAPGAWYRFGKFAARHRLGVALGAGAVLSLLAVTAVAVVMGLQARDESARAVAARDFMLNIFKRADQEKSRGADITARDMLETGRKDVLTRLAGQPRLQAELLQGIGEIQIDMSEFSGASATFADVAELFVRLGIPKDVSMARANHADAAMRTGDLQQAQRLLQQARSVPNRPEGDNLLNLRLSQVEGWIAYSQGDAAQAKLAFLAAQRYAAAGLAADDVRAMEPLRGLVYAERDLRNYDAALRQQAALELLASKLVGNDPKEWAVLDFDRAAILFAAGRYAQGLTDAAKALSRCEAAQLPRGEYCQRLRLYKARFALKVGAPESVAGDVALLQALAADARDSFMQADALGMLLRLDAARGAFASAQVNRERLEALCNAAGDIQLDTFARHVAFMTIAEFSLREGSLERARAQLDRAGSLSKQLGEGLPATVRASSALLVGLLQLRTGQVDASVATLETAYRFMASVEGRQHPVSVLLSLNLAIAIDAAGDTASALRIVAEAEPVLRESVGRQSATYRRYQTLAEAMRTKLQGRGASVEAKPASVNRDVKPITTDLFI